MEPSSQISFILLLECSDLFLEGWRPIDDLYGEFRRKFALWSGCHVAFVEPIEEVIFGFITGDFVADCEEWTCFVEVQGWNGWLEDLVVTVGNRHQQQAIMEHFKVANWDLDHPRLLEDWDKSQASFDSVDIKVRDNSVEQQIIVITIKLQEHFDSDSKILMEQMKLERVFKLVAMVKSSNQRFKDLKQYFIIKH